MLDPLPRPESAPTVERIDASATVPSSGNNSVANGRSHFSLAEWVEEGKTVTHNGKAHSMCGLPKWEIEMPMPSFSHTFDLFGLR